MMPLTGNLGNATIAGCWFVSTRHQSTTTQDQKMRNITDVYTTLLTCSARFAAMQLTWVRCFVRISLPRSPLFSGIWPDVLPLGYVDMIFTSERPIWEQEHRGFGYKPYNPCPVDPAAKAPTAEPATEGQSSILAAAPAPDLAAAPACATLVVKPEKKFELYRFKCEKCSFAAKPFKSDGLKQHIFSKHTPNNQKKW